MIKSACSTMKKSLALSGVLLLTGIILEVIAQFLSLESMIPALFAYAGAISIFLGFIVLVAALIAMMIPKVNRDLDSCQH